MLINLLFVLINKNEASKGCILCCLVSLELTRPLISFLEASSFSLVLFNSKIPWQMPAFNDFEALTASACYDSLGGDS